MSHISSCLSTVVCVHRQLWGCLGCERWTCITPGCESWSAAGFGCWWCRGVSLNYMRFCKVLSAPSHGDGMCEKDNARCVSAMYFSIPETIIFCCLRQSVSQLWRLVRTKHSWVIKSQVWVSEGFPRKDRREENVKNIVFGPTFFPHIHCVFFFFFWLCYVLFCCVQSFKLSEIPGEKQRNWWRVCLSIAGSHCARL